MRFQFGDFELDDQARELRRAGEPVPLSPRQLDVLLHLVRHRDRLVGKDELLETVWAGARRSESTLPTCISALRRQLGDGPPARIILTRYGRGYFFAAPVREIAGAGGRTFVGRERELAEFSLLAKEARNGRGSVLLVAGEAGIGKTRLLEEMRLLARSEGMLPLRAHCSEVQGAAAFAPWVQILRGYIGSHSAREVRSALGEGAAHVARIVPEIRDKLAGVPQPHPVSPASARFLLFESIVATLESAAAHAPLALLIDDAHRIDEASLELLESLVTRVDGLPLVVAVSFRSVELELSSWRRAAMARIARGSATRAIELRGLADAEVATLVQETLGRAPSAAALRALVDQTAGNPFFLTHLLHYLKVTGDAVLASESWSSALPGNVREAIRKHVETLPEETRAALALAAVAGRHFPLAVFVRAAALGPDRVRDTLAPALAAGVLTEPEADAFSFRHILLRDAIYEALSAPTRKALHGRVLGALEELHGEGGVGPHLPEMAHHAREALDGSESKRAVALSVRAASWASGTFAYEEAVHQYENALRVAELAAPVDRGERAEILIGCGEALIRANQRERGETRLREAMAIARDLGDADRLARAACAFSPGFLALEAGVVDHFRIDALEEALAGLPTEAAALRSEVLANIALALYWTDSRGRRKALVADAVAEAQRSGEPRAIAFALTAHEVALWDPSEPERRVAVADQAIRLAEEAEDREMELDPRPYRPTTLLQLARFVEWDQEIETFAHKAEQLRQPQALWFSNLFKAVRAWMRGDWAGAQALAERFREQGRVAADINAEHCFVVHAAIRAWHVGNAVEAADVVLRRSAAYPSILSYRCVVAALQANWGERRIARQLVAEVLEGGLERIPPDVHWLACVGMLAEACVALGDEDRARLLYDALLPFDHQVMVGAYCVSSWHPISYHLGRLAHTVGRFDTAERHARQAVEESVAAQSPPWVAHAGFALAELLRERGRAEDQAEIGELAKRALETTREFGMAPLRTRVEAFLSRR